MPTHDITSRCKSKHLPSVSPRACLHSLQRLYFYCFWIRILYTLWHNGAESYAWCGSVHQVDSISTGQQWRHSETGQITVGWAESNCSLVLSI